MGNELGMQYIMDGNGNYYTLGGDGQLIVAKDRDEAAVFTFSEANQKIGDGKKAKFYYTIPVEEIEETKKEMLAGSGEIAMEACTDDDVSKVFSIVEKMQITANEQTEKNASSPTEQSQSEIAIPATPVKPQPNFRYSMEDTDWNEFANYYIFLASNIKGYQEELTKQESDIDKMICDLLHYVELYDLTDEEGLRAMDLLKDARQRRRDIKNELCKADYFQKSIGTSANVAKAKGFLTQLKKLDTQKYHPRFLSELFAGMHERATDRDAYRQRRQMKLEEEVSSEELTQENMEEPEMNYAETVYDQKENDWLGFARQQMEFYRNAGQYMMNLRIEIDTIDQEIENVMEKIEDANYNVAQGYKVFKELKDLRNERKYKAQELEVLRTMTECFDLDAMADAWDYNVREVENITGEKGNEAEEQEQEKEIAV